VDYVRAVAARYRGRIRAYEIWNEPNFAQFFSGSTETMLRLAKSAYGAIKAVDSTAVVVSPAPTGRDGLRWFRDFVRLDGLSYADVVGYHFYVEQDQSPEAMVPLIEQVRNILVGQDRQGMQIWNTETGWILKGSQGIPAGHEKWATATGLGSSTAAATLCRAYLVGLAFGLGRFYWYSWDHYAMGLVEPDGHTAKAAARSLRLLEGWLVGTRLVGRSVSGGTWALQFEDGDGSRFAVVWHPRGQGRWKPPWPSAKCESVVGGGFAATSWAPKGFPISAAPLRVEPAK
jgi:hypothetical protein